MQRSLSVFVLAVAAVAAAPAAARPGDRFESAACQRALEAVRAQEDVVIAARAAGAASAAAHRAALGDLEPLRDTAIEACLGGRPESPPPSQHLAQPPIRVQPWAPSVPAVRVPQVVPPPPAPPRPPDPLRTITRCDPAGCWASDGTRLLRSGPMLIGPRGHCTTVGVVLHCR